MSLLRLMRCAVAAIVSVLLTPAMAGAQPDPLAPDAPVQEETQEASVATGLMETRDGVHALTKADVDAWLDGFMPYALADGGIVGAVVSVVNDGEILTSRGYGYADLETKAPMDPAATLIRPGSVSKLFTWTAVMQLVEQGKIDLDEDVNAYLDFKIPDKFGAPIKVRHLLTHTAGFEEAIKRILLKDETYYIGLEEYVKTALPARIFPPGEVPAYSNYATTLAGYIVQRVSGQSFDEYVEQQIFAPLGMNNSSFRQPLSENLAAKMSKGFKNANDGEAQFYEFVTPAPAGSLAATADDMARFMIAHLQEGGSILSPETTRQMHTTLDAKLPPLNAMALGFYQQDRFGLAGIGHGGDTSFFHSNLSLFPDKGAGIFISMNSAGSGGVTLALREALSTEFGLRYFPEAAPVEEPTLETAKEHGALLAGVYEASRTAETNFFAVTRYLGQMTIAMNDKDELVFDFLGAPSRWREIEPYVWRRVGSYERLSASIRDGKVYQLSFEPLSAITVYTPPPAYRSSALLNPLLFAALAALTATALLWPARAIVRRRFRTPFPLSGAAAMSHRLVHVGVAAVLAYLVGWAVFFTGSMSEISGLTPALDPKLRVMQAAQLVLYAALALSIWNAATVWGAKRSWFAKLWSVVLPLSIGVVIWFAAIAGFLSFSLTY